MNNNVDTPLSQINYQLEICLLLHKQVKSMVQKVAEVKLPKCPAKQAKYKEIAKLDVIKVYPAPDFYLHHEIFRLKDYRSEGTSHQD